MPSVPDSSILLGALESVEADVQIIRVSGTGRWSFGSPTSGR